MRSEGRREVCQSAKLVVKHYKTRQCVACGAGSWPDIYLHLDGMHGAKVGLVFLQAQPLCHCTYGIAMEKDVSIFSDVCKL